MSQLFGGIFGRAEKSAPISTSTVVIDGEEVDMEYAKYCIEQDRTVSALEARLHKSDDPKEIAEGALKAACLFYGGDWAGILDVDLDLDVWTPLWWYNTSPNDKTTTQFGEFELAKYALTAFLELVGIRCCQLFCLARYYILRRFEGRGLTNLMPVHIVTKRNHDTESISSLFDTRHSIRLLLMVFRCYTSL